MPVSRWLTGVLLGLTLFANVSAVAADKRTVLLDRQRDTHFAKWLAERGMVKTTPPIDTYAAERGSAK